VSCARMSPTVGGMADALDDEELLAPIRQHFKKSHRK